MFVFLLFLRLIPLVDDDDADEEEEEEEEEEDDVSLAAEKTGSWNFDNDNLSVASPSSTLRFLVLLGLDDML